MAKAGARVQEEGLARRIWHSVFRGPFRPDSNSDRARIVLGNLILHFRPVRTPAKTLPFTHTWGLGGMSATLFLLLVLTGIPLMFVYEPSPGYAWDSVLSIRNNVFFGNLVRSIHYWSANFLVALLLLHIARVYFTAAYHAPRQFNWVIGLTLFGCVLVSSFTGYLLPWDQLSYWAVTIVTGMLAYIPFAGEWLQQLVRGGTEIGPATLVNFYTLHTTLVPVSIVLLMALHFWRVRRAKGVVIPRAPGEPVDENPEMVHALPHLFTRELAAGLVLVAFVLVTAFAFNAPHGEPANPGMSPDPARAPWYFMGFQEMLIHFDPLFAVLVIPLLATIGLLMIPYVNYDTDTSGIFMMSHRGRRVCSIAALTSAVLTPLAVVVDEFAPGFATWLPSLPPAINQGLFPAGLVALFIAGFYAFTRRRLGANTNEAVQGVAVLASVAFVILTIVGFWFRGSGMALVWPWGS
jgi:quinol-cytochrome oxidoreductase complex cytochrome b subunit